MSQENSRFSFKDGRPNPGEQAFTLVELLTVVVTVMLLAILLLPALAASKQTGQGSRCLENHRRLVAAWRMYAEDNGGILPPNDYPYTTAYLGQPISSRYKFKSWVCGTMNQGIDARGGFTSATYSLLEDPVGTALAPYVRDRNLYHCPADRYVDPYAGQVVHCRSYSMNAAVGTQWYGAICGNGTAPCGSTVTGAWLPGNAYNPSQTIWSTYDKLSSFIKPGPSSTFVIMDENPITINDSSIAFSAAASRGATYLIDYPSGNHDGAAAISFADGHAVIHTWLDPRTYGPPQTLHGMGGTSSMLQSPDNPDCDYAAHITSAPR